MKILNRMHNEWSRNKRFRIGVVCIAVILSAYGYLLLDDWESRLKITYYQKLDMAVRLEQLSVRTDWLKHEKSAGAVVIQLESKLWRAESRGLAQAKTQIWIETLLKTHGVENPRISVKPAKLSETVSRVWEVAAKVDAAVNLNDLHRLLKSIEGSGHIVAIEQLDIVQARYGRMEMTLKTYFHAESV